MEDDQSSPESSAETKSDMQEEAPVITSEMRDLVPNTTPRKFDTKMAILSVSVLAMFAGVVWFATNKSDTAIAPDTSSEVKKDNAQPTIQAVIAVSNGLKGYYIDSQNKLTESVDITVPPFYEGRGAYSPSGHLYAYFEEGTGYPTESYITVESEDGTVAKEQVIEAWNQSHGPLVPIAWTDEQNVILEEYSCFECDGPQLPRIYSLNISTGKLTLLLDLVEDNNIDQVSAGQVYVNPDATGAAIIVGTNTFWTNYQEIITETNQIYYYDFKTDKASLVYTKPKGADHVTDVIGFTGDSLIVDLRTYKKTDLVNPGNASEGNNFAVEFKNVSIVDIASGKASVIPLQISELGFDADIGSPKGKITSAIYETNRLLFVTRSPQYENDATYRLRVLQIGQGEGSIETLLTSPSEIHLNGTTEINSL